MQETANIFENIRQQFKLSIKPIVLKCKCGLKSDNTKDIPVLYRSEYENPLCQICYMKLIWNKRYERIKANPEEYLVFCGIEGKDKFYSFENYKDKYPQLDEIKNYAESKLSDLLLIGGTGVGKKHLIVAIMRRLIERGVDYRKMFYITEKKFNDDLIRAQKEDYKAFEIVWQKYRGYKLLIIDEIGFKEPSEFAITSLTDLVTDRQADETKTIFISNYSLDRIQADYGDPLHSRLHLFRKIEIPKFVKDYRKSITLK